MVSIRMSAYSQRHRIRQRAADRRRDALAAPRKWPAVDRRL